MVVKMADRPYTYDATRPHLMRLFKLDLNEPDEPLSGKLLSITNIDFGMLTFTPRLWYQMFSEDLYYLFDELSDGKGYDALSYCWGDPKEPRPLRVSSISNKIERCPLCPELWNGTYWKETGDIACTRCGESLFNFASIPFCPLSRKN